MVFQYASLKYSQTKSMQGLDIINVCLLSTLSLAPIFIDNNRESVKVEIHAVTNSQIIKPSRNVG